jgi:hypothetical protein
MAAMPDMAFWTQFKNRFVNLKVLQSSLLKAYYDTDREIGGKWQLFPFTIRSCENVIVKFHLQALFAHVANGVICNLLHFQNGICLGCHCDKWKTELKTVLDDMAGDRCHSHYFAHRETVTVETLIDETIESEFTKKNSLLPWYKPFVANSVKTNAAVILVLACHVHYLSCKDQSDMRQEVCDKLSCLVWAMAKEIADCNQPSC